MKQLFIDCQMGVAGDMLLAALLELTEQPELFAMKLEQMGITGLRSIIEKTEREGLEGTQIHISVEDAGDGRRLTDVYRVIDGLYVSDKVKTDAKNVYRIIAEAEAEVHETDIEHVHFHEVGSLNAITDITGVCMVMEALCVDHVTVSPIHVGSGMTRCAHGILPVPAPATARIVTNLPTYRGDVSGELCTPTGAALIKYFADEFRSMEGKIIGKSGRGFGTKKFPGRINGLHVILIEK